MKSTPFRSIDETAHYDEGPTAVMDTGGAVTRKAVVASPRASHAPKRQRRADPPLTSHADVKQPTPLPTPLQSPSLWNRLVDSTPATPATSTAQVRHLVALADSDEYAREETLSSLLHLPPDDLAPYAADIASTLDDETSRVRWLAVKALRRLPAHLLAYLAPALVQRLHDSSGRVRLAALETVAELPPGALSQHGALAISAIAGEVSECELMRAAALETLSRLPPPLLATHAAVVADALEDVSRIIRTAALRTLTHLDARSLMRHSEAVALRTMDVHPMVREAARETLRQIERKRVEHGRALWSRLRTYYRQRYLVEYWAQRAWAPGGLVHSELVAQWALL